MRLAAPYFLVLLLAPLWVLVQRWRRRTQPPAERLAFPGVRLVRQAGSTLRARWHALPATLGLLGLTLLVLGLARPQVPGNADPTRIRSRNIMLILDISSSMKATDFKPDNRLGVAKTVADLFRYRRTISDALPIEGLRQALRQRKATPAEITREAKAAGVWATMEPYVMALTSDA